MSMIRTLEHDYGNLGSVPDDHPQLLVIQAHVRKSDSARLKAKSLGLNKKRVGLWSNEEKQFLADHYATHTARELAEKLKRTRQTTQRMIHELGLKKNNV